MSRELEVRRLRMDSPIVEKAFRCAASESLPPRAPPDQIYVAALEHAALGLADALDRMQSELNHVYSFGLPPAALPAKPPKAPTP